MIFRRWYLILAPQLAFPRLILTAVPELDLKLSQRQSHQAWWWGGCSKLAWSKNWGYSWTFWGYCSYQAQHWMLQQQLSNSFRDKVRATAWYTYILYSGLRTPLDSCRIPRQKSYVLIACKPGVALKLLPHYSHYNLPIIQHTCTYILM